MTERFHRLFQLPANQYIQGSPVIISAGVLLKDNISGNIIAQIKFQSVSIQKIKAVKLSLSAFDISGKELHGISDYQYLDLSISNGQEFGSTKAIVLPDPVTRSIAINSIIVVYVDGNVWKSSLPFTLLPPQKELSNALSSMELEKQYRLSTNSFAAYVPQESEGLWQCSCGRWNYDGYCSNCKIDKTKSLTTLNIPVLTENMNIRLEQEKRKQEEEKARQAQLQAKAEIARKERQKRIKRFIYITTVLVIFIGIGCFIYKKTTDLNIDKLLPMYTKQDVLSLIGNPNDEKDNSYYVSFMGKDYNLTFEYDANKIKSWHLSYPRTKNSDNKTAFQNHEITMKDRKKAHKTLSAIISTLTDKYGSPKIPNSNVSKSYIWIVNDRKITIYDYIDNDNWGSLFCAFMIDVNCDHQSFCEHTDVKIETVEATCTQAGYIRKTCTICGSIDETSQKPLGHKNTSIITVEATCSKEGEKKTTCSVCGLCTEEKMPVLDHDYRQTITATAGCETTGTYTYTCTSCNSEYTEPIPALGHSMIAATCTEPETCSRCAKKGAPAHGHSWNENFVCINCSTPYQLNISIKADLPHIGNGGLLTITSVSIDSMTPRYFDKDGNVHADVTIRITGTKQSKNIDQIGFSILDGNGERLSYPYSYVMFSLDRDHHPSFSDTYSLILKDGDVYTLDFLN